MPSVAHFFLIHLSSRDTLEQFKVIQHSPWLWEQEMRINLKNKSFLNSVILDQFLKKSFIIVQ